MPIAFNGSTSGKVTVQAAATAANNTLTLPNGNGMLVGQSTTTAPTNGQIPIGNGTDYTPATITAGSNITVTNGAGSITIAASGSSGTVTSITAGTGLSGGTITTSGTISLVTTTGAVGTYAYLQATAANVTVSPGGTRAGSGLYYSGVAGQINTSINTYGACTYNTGGSPAGTWQCMGYLLSGGAGCLPYGGSSLFIRIA